MSHAVPSARTSRVLCFALVLAVACAPLTACGPPKRKAPTLRTTIPDPLAAMGAEREFEGFTAGPGVDLSGLDLAREDFSGLDLSGSNFEGTKFARSWLSRSKFVGANLSGADAVAVNAYRADFSGADLTNASFVGANLEEAVFTGAKLDGADFSFAFLRGAILDESATSVAIFSGATMPDGSIGD